MESHGPYMTDVIGKCLREVIAVQGKQKSAGHRYLLRSATYAAALKRRRLDLEYVTSREEKAFLVYTEDIKTGAIARYPVAVDEVSGIVRQLNAPTRFGLLEDVIQCLHRKTSDGAFLVWHTAKVLERQWVDPNDADISLTNPANSTYGSIAGGGRRVGQDAFRRAVSQLWNGACPLCGAKTSALLKASHILRWEHGTTDQRNDPHNGILLAAHFDAAFEVGLISFADDGLMLISNRLSLVEMEAIGIRHDMRLPFVPSRSPQYLKWHRIEHGFQKKG
jgi:hypothetical protein